MNLENVKKFTLNANSKSKLKSFRILNEAALMKEFDDIIDQIQELLNTHLIKDILNFLETPYYLKVKIWSLSLKR